MAVIKYYDGTAWKAPFFLYPKIWDGTQWVQAIPKYWDGTQWRTANLSGSSFTVSVGNTNYIGLGGKSGQSNDQYYYGFSSSAPTVVTSAFGSCSNASINSLYWLDINRTDPLGNTTDTYSVVFSANNIPNNSWNTLKIGTTSYLAANATYAISGTTSNWTWVTTSTNPFGTSLRATVNATFA